MIEHKTDMNITEKLSSTSMMEYKTDMNITKIDKYKKLNSTSTAEYKTDLNITEKMSSTFRKEH